MLDVIIVGAGVAGNFIAWKLSEKGYKVLVLEEHPVIGQPVKCTGIIGEDCVKEFPFLQPFVIKSFKEATLYSPSGLKLKISNPSPKAFLINRALLDDHLARMAKISGANFILSAKVRGVIPHPGKGCVMAEMDGKGVCFTGRALVISPGFTPSLLNGVGVKAGEGVIGAQVEVEVGGSEGVEVYIGSQIAPGFFAWLVPYLDGRGVAGLISYRPKLYLERFLDRLRAEGKIGCWGKAVYKYLPLKPLQKTYGDGFLVVGEAAGQIKPLTFGGIYYGLLCARIACQVLDKALSRNDLSSRLLSCYQRGWKRLLGKEIAIALWARKLYQHLPDNKSDRLFEFASSSDIIDRLLFPGFSFDWHSQLIIRAIKTGLLSAVKRF